MIFEYQPWRISWAWHRHLRLVHISNPRGLTRFQVPDGGVSSGPSCHLKVFLGLSGLKKGGVWLEGVLAHGTNFFLSVGFYVRRLLRFYCSSCSEEQVIFRLWRGKDEVIVNTRSSKFVFSLRSIMHNYRNHRRSNTAWEGRMLILCPSRRNQNQEYFLTILYEYDCTRCILLSSILSGPFYTIGRHKTNFRSESTKPATPGRFG